MPNTVKKIAVIVAHPDDEALGAGGYLIKAREEGHEIHLLFFTDGVSAREATPKAKEARAKKFSDAMKFINPTSFQRLDFPDNQLDTVPFLKIIKQCESFLSELKPDVLLTHYSHDLNIDHQIVARAAFTAARPMSASYVKKVLSFEVPSSTDWNIGNQKFSPNFYIDISSFIEEKMRYLEHYDTELRQPPHARSLEKIRALSSTRGAECGVHFAESYMLVRDCNNVT